MARSGTFASPLAEHVFIISIDGGKPAVIERSAMPTLQRLASEGASTWRALTIFPSLTLPSHTSMLTGVAAEKHRILWNSWKPRKGVVSVPTIFFEAKSAGLSTAMFVGKEKFLQLLQPGTVDEFEFKECLAADPPNPGASGANAKQRGTIPARVVALAAVKYIQEKKPNLCFIHFTDADDAGHKYGWGSPQQIKALEAVDLALAQVLSSIEAAGISQRSVLIITADHGGHRKTHGRYSADDMFIPWIAWGKPVKTSFSISSSVATYDTGATALWLLGVPVPESFDGKPIVAAFSSPTEPERPLAHRGLNTTEAGSERSDGASH
jgi:predicted AlkP superfamily pyrophosphatase or phosphodiesterase